MATFIENLIHFVILSAICGGLWWAINWFAAEVAAFKKEEEQRKEAEREKNDIKKTKEGEESREPDIDESASASLHAETTQKETVPDSGPAASSSAIATVDARPRLVSPPSSGNISADSDWERIETVEK
ncbi:hypothetical protein KEM54_004051 [Ascosphaera aggregata]|nr:hypothetical protein KEM54_004051 [Ascosphaera aggregata]